ncbi:unnamed protein product, partial [Owenia fusiformis]
TDGLTFPGSRKRATLTQARLLKNEGVEVFVVAVPNKKDKVKDKARQEWETIASEPADEHIYEVNEFEELVNLIYKMTGDICPDVANPTTTKSPRTTLKATTTIKPKTTQATTKAPEETTTELEKTTPEISVTTPPMLPKACGVDI